MYRLNFYPEYFERRKSARKVVLGMALASLLLGLGGILLAVQFISAHLLDEKTQALQESIPRLSEGLIEESEAPPEVRIARTLVEIRAERMDWAPKLAVLAEQIDPSLKLLRIEAHSADKSAPTTLELNGEIRQREDQLAAVSAYIQALQGDARLAADLPSVRLGNLKEGSASQFLLICESQGGNKR